jgi:hypothetical protein
MGLEQLAAVVGGDVTAGAEQLGNAGGRESAEAWKA